MAGMLIPLLLYADDIVLLGRTRVAVQRLLHYLHAFCVESGLEVNMDKTVWLLGGYVPVGFVAGELWYAGMRVRQVAEFKYLGLVLGGHGLKPMVDARVGAARVAWRRLQGVLVQHGWRDRATRLVLFDTFVKTTLLFGTAVWGSHVLPSTCQLSRDATGPLGVLYRGALRALLGVGKLRNEIVYVLSGRLPL